jgi:drug/metabolite transporter (DMT)-like permease
MTSIAVGLVLLSALLHATWNFVAKKAHNNTAFVWLLSTMEVLLFFPIVLVVVLIEQYTIGWLGVLFMAVAGCLHIAYFVLLGRGYQVGDLSIVYPLARGIGPLIATVAAIALFDERPTPLALAGSVLICGGVFWLTGDPRRLRSNEALPAVAFATLCGIAIAGYTLWDSYAVGQLLLPVILYQWGLAVFRVLLLVPVALRQRVHIQEAWTRDKWKAAFIGFVSPVSYALMLAAFVISPVSYVAPMRTVSTLMGVAMGTRLLNEGNTLGRLSAAAVMVLGVIALSLG